MCNSLRWIISIILVLSSGWSVVIDFEFSVLPCCRLTVCLGNYFLGSLVAQIFIIIEYAVRFYSFLFSAMFFVHDEFGCILGSAFFEWSAVDSRWGVSFGVWYIVCCFALICQLPFVMTASSIPGPSEFRSSANCLYSSNGLDLNLHEDFQDFIRISSGFYQDFIKIFFHKFSGFHSFFTKIPGWTMLLSCTFPIFNIFMLEFDGVLSRSLRVHQPTTTEKKVASCC